MSCGVCEIVQKMQDDPAGAFFAGMTIGLIHTQKDEATFFTDAVEVSRAIDACPEHHARLLSLLQASADAFGGR